ncbi:MAG TPA: ABC transporter substrate-binding protein [Stellaceae bacterium]|nr:ABC transporter substrate-binding protein [Stellaceae bacterium]
MKRAAFCLLLALAIAGSASAETKLKVGKSGGPLLLTLVELGQHAKIWQGVGLEVESIEFAGEAKTMQALAAGATDLGFGSGIGLAFPLKGVPATAVAAVSNPPNMLALVVPPASPIKSVDDLKGKTIGVSTVGSLTEWVTKELSRQRGWGVDGIRPLPVGTPTNAFAAMATGQIDGDVTGVGSAYTAQEAGKARIVLTFGDYIKIFHANVLYAANTLIAQNPAAISAFLKGWFQSLAYAHAHPDVAAQVAAETEHLSLTAATAAYDKEVFSMASKDGAFDPAAIEVVRRALKETGVMEDVPPAEKLYSSEFVPVRY